MSIHYLTPPSNVEAIPPSFAAHQNKVLRITITGKNGNKIVDPNEDPPSSVVTAFAKTEHGTPTIHGIQFNVPITRGNDENNDSYYDKITISVVGLVPGQVLTVTLTATFEIRPGADNMPVITATNTTYQLD